MEWPPKANRAHRLDHSSLGQRRFQTTAHRARRAGDQPRLSGSPLAFTVALETLLPLDWHEAQGALGRRGSQKTSPSAPCSRACRWHSRPSTRKSPSQVRGALQPLSRPPRGVGRSAACSPKPRDRPRPLAPPTSESSARSDWWRGGGGAPVGRGGRAGRGQSREVERLPRLLAGLSRGFLEAVSDAQQLGPGWGCQCLRW